MSTPQSNSGARIRPSGFSARVDGAGLAELIQLNCLGQKRAVFEVSSGAARGLLFFADGRIVHAEFGQQSGVPAVHRMLTLEGGRFRPCHASWPAQHSIHEPWESVMRAAQAHDDSVSPRSASGDLVEFPGVSKPMKDPVDEFSSCAVVHLDAAGRVLHREGPVEGLEDSAAYVKQVADALGEQLGLGPVFELTAATQTQHLVVRLGGAGQLVAARGTEQELRKTLREGVDE